MSGQFLTAPVPLQFTVGRAAAGTPTGSGPLTQETVIVSVLSPMGQQILYFDLDAAQRFGKAILEAAGQIVIAPASTLTRPS